MESMTTFSANWNPFFYDLLQATESSVDQVGYYNPVVDVRSHANSALSFAFDSAGEISPQPSNSSPIRFGSFSSMSMLGSSSSQAMASHGKPSDNTTPSSGFIPSDEEHELVGIRIQSEVANNQDDEVFETEQSENEDYWRAWNIQTAPGCPSLDKLFENKRRWRERFHKSAPPPLQRVCVFCRNTGRSPALFTSHVIRNEKGEITCPVLSSKFCHKCGVKGHTANYCYTTKSNSGSSSGSKSNGVYNQARGCRVQKRQIPAASWR